MMVLFFFSSRRLHTRCSRDWSSHVCSSDLLTGVLGNLFPAFLFGIAIQQQIQSSLAGILNSLTPLFVIVIGALFRSEERRVGKECRSLLPLTYQKINLRVI